MKYFTILLLFIPSVLLSESMIKYRVGDWYVAVEKDDFTDALTCSLVTRNSGHKDKPGIILFAKHSPRPFAMLYANGGIYGVGITYRVDKNKPVTFGFKYDFETENEFYPLHTSEYNQLVNDFKAGNQVVYEGHSGNQFVDSSREKISLSGFTKAYNLAVKCDY